VTARVYVFLLAGTLLAALGQVMFKVGATGRDTLAGFVNVWILGGLAAYGIGTLLWIYSLSKAPLTLVYPFTALTFVLVYLLGLFWLGETSSIRALTGVALVLVGLLLISTA
jgi:drug/metabolite transporter (DMT)-like permease